MNKKKGQSEKELSQGRRFTHEEYLKERNNKRS